MLNGYDSQWLPGSPTPSREIGKINGLASRRDRPLTKFRDGTEGGGVVNIHVRRFTAQQALDEAVIHDVVHAAVAGTFRFFR